MKALGLILFLTLAYATGVKAANSAVPVGACVVRIAAAADPSNPSLSALSIPFYGTVTASGVVSSVDGSRQVSASGFAWAVDQHVASPTYLRVKSGSSKGRYFRVVGNSASQLTLDTGAYSLVAGTPASALELQLKAGDAFELFLAHTLGSVFGTTSVPLLSGSSVDLADNVLLLDGTKWVEYFHDGNGWKSTAMSGEQNQTVIAPGAALFVRRRATSVVDVSILGTVPGADEVVNLAASATQFFGARFPVDTTVGALGMASCVTWKSGASASAADCLRMWNGFAWETFYFNGKHWRKSGSLANCDTQKVPACSGVLIVRSAAPIVDEWFTLQLPYSF